MKLNVSRWITESDFGDPEQVTTFNKVIPPTFNRTKIGEMWHAPQAWIGKFQYFLIVTMIFKHTADNEKAAYYAENPQAKDKIDNAVFQAERRRLQRKEEMEAEAQGRKPFTRPVRHQC